MDSLQAYTLDVLSKETALSLFAQHALGRQSFDKHPRLKLHGEDIVDKCGRLPLALMTLGRVLRSKTNDEEWAELLKNEIWNLPNDQSDILPALRLSYYDLPSHLKQLFAYCCLFPKDYIFVKDELVLLWMADGFLHKSNPNKSMEIFGREYFDELKSRSFFQQCESGYTMHDLIHDLAMSVGGEFFFTSGDKMGNEASEKVHHLSFIRKRFGVYKEFKALQKTRRLRTLLSVSMSDRVQGFKLAWRKFFLSNRVILELLPELRFLRVLSLTDYSIEEVPQSIGCFNHMRYLNFSRTDITCLPDQIADLCNLQSLLISGCHRLSSLPNKFAKLINLRHLDISDTPKLNKMPLGIGRLKSLRTLSKVIIAEANGFKISELKGLLHLQGQLLIEGLEKVVNPIQAKDANLQQRKDLDDLELKWSDVFEDSRNKKIEYEVLEGLRPHHSLINLNISFYGGIGFPSWIGESSFAQLTELILRGCISCTRLPTLGHLRSLKKLFVSSMSEVKTLDIELLTPSNSFHGIAFPSLEVLKFEDMQSWEKWSTSGGDNNDTIGSFPSLCDISIENCPKLVDVSVALISSVRVLHVEGCSEEVLKSMVGVSSSIRELNLRNIKGLTQLQGEVLKHLRAVEYIYIKECDELRYLCESESEFLTSLRKLELTKCKNLVSLGENVEVNSQNSMELVREVMIYDCESLRSYRSPNNVERLGIQECPSITSLTFPSTLKFLCIKSCENLEESWPLNNILSSLESLIIWHYGNLRWFPEGCFAHLTNLDIWSCDNIESILEQGFGSLPLRCLMIVDCKNLKSFPHEQLQSLTSLDELHINNCPNIDHSFPSGLWPPNLRSLEIGCLKKPMSEWGLQNYPTSLVELHLYGTDSGVVSFAEAQEDGTSSSSTLILPPSLLSLNLLFFEDVESVSEGLQHLTHLEQLTIKCCIKVRDLPETRLPSLSSLTVRYCSKLEKHCCRGKGKYWPIISQIPHLYLDGDDYDSFIDVPWTRPN